MMGYGAIRPLNNKGDYGFKMIIKLNWSINARGITPVSGFDCFCEKVEWKNLAPLFKNLFGCTIKS